MYSTESIARSCARWDASSLHDSSSLSTWTEKEEIAAQQLVLLHEFLSHIAARERHHLTHSATTTDDYKAYLQPSSPCSSIKSDCASNSRVVEHHLPHMDISDSCDGKPSLPCMRWSRRSGDHGTRVSLRVRKVPLRGVRRRRYRLLKELYGTENSAANAALTTETRLGNFPLVQNADCL